MARETEKTLLRPSPFLRDLILTQATGVCTMAGLLVVMGLLAQGLGPEKFGVYFVARRTLMAVLPLATLAMGVALTRYAALSGKGEAGFPVFLGGLILGVAPSAIIFVIGAVFSRQVSTVVFGHERYHGVTMAVLFMVSGYALYTVLYSVYRGTNRMRRANLWQLGVLVLVPLIVAATYAKSGRVALILFLMGAALYAAAVPLIFRLVGGLMSSGSARGTGQAMQTLLRYSLPRVPGNFAKMALFAAPPFLARKLIGMEEAGFLAAAQSLMIVTQGGMDAFALVALPKVAKLFADGHEDLVRGGIGNIIAFVVHVGTFAVLHLALWSDWIVPEWLGPKYDGAIIAFRITAIAVLPYAAFVMLRAIIDAVEEKAVNARNLIMGLATAVGASLVLVALGLGTTGLAVGSVVGFLVLGLSTTSYLWRRFRIERRQLLIKWVVLLNAGLILCAWAVKSALGPAGRALWALAAAVLCEAVLAAVYFFVLRRLKAGWISELEKRLVTRRSKGPQPPEPVESPRNPDTE